MVRIHIPQLLDSASNSNIRGGFIILVSLVGTRLSRITKRVTATILSMSLLTLMAAAIAPAMGIILFGTNDITRPYRVAVLISILFLLQVWMTHRFQSLPPKK